MPQTLPTVLINSPETGDHFALRVDNRGGLVACVEHLLDTGRRGIVHLAGAAGNIDAEERAQAYLATMAARAPGLPVRVLHGDFGEGSGAQLTRELIAQGVAFDAIVAGNDMMALGALTALREAGIAVPDQVAVTGFDDVPLARYLGLTTVRVDIVAMGERAVDALTAIIAGKADAPRTTTELSETRLITRTTTLGS